MIPYTVKYFLNEFISFAARGSSIRLTMDFTHDICNQKYKLGVISAVGCHFSQGQWRNTTLPIFYCLASSECSAAYLPLLQAAKFCLREMFNGFDFIEKTVAIYTDAHEAGKIATEIELSNTKHFLCLEHAKKALSRNSDKWKFGKKTWKSRNQIEVLMFVSNPFLCTFACIVFPKNTLAEMLKIVMPKQKRR